MANTQSGNSWYVDTASAALSTRKVKISAIVLSSTGSAGSIVIRETSGASDALRVNVPANETYHLDLSERELLLPSGLYIQSISNAVATIILRQDN